jgi:3-dehydroquinate synthase
MEALLMYKELSIESSRKVYDVYTIQDLNTTILKDGDVWIIDSNIAAIYEEELSNFFVNDYMIVEACEESKTLDKVAEVLNYLISIGFKKPRRLVAIGGGIIQDITSFSASVLHRGVDWIFLPTTLLAQCDSCIGSKTSINLGAYKNQVGSFYPPSSIYIYPPFIDTLKADDIRSGVGEMLHYFLIDGEDSFKDINDNYDDILTDINVRERFVLQSLGIKKPMVELDEYDSKERRVFNYGHSFGHAIETITSFEISHGIAVSIGMVIANYVSMEMEYLSKRQFNKMYKLLKRNFTEEEVRSIDSSLIAEVILKDKKNVDGAVNLILTKGIGRMFVQSIQDINMLSKLIEGAFVYMLKR